MFARKNEKIPEGCGKDRPSSTMQRLGSMTIQQGYALWVYNVGFRVGIESVTIFHRKIGL